MLDKTIEVDLGGETVKRKHVILIAASDAETAAKFLSRNLGFNGTATELIWLPNLNYQTIYDASGNEPLKLQAKIMYNTVTLVK